MTRRCCYCTPKHIIGPDHGEPYTDGLCAKAYAIESVRIFFRWQLPRYLRTAETWLTRTAVVYFLAQMVRWGLNDFAIVGK